MNNSFRDIFQKSFKKMVVGWILLYFNIKYDLTYGKLVL